MFPGGELDAKRSMQSPFEPALEAYLPTIESDTQASLADSLQGHPVSSTC